MSIFEGGATPRVLLWDIEASKLEADFGHIFCIGYEWLGENKPKIITLTDFPRFKRHPADDRYVVEAFSKVLGEADAQVTWFGTYFDIPYLQSRLIQHGLKPLRPVPHIDGWAIARKKLKLHSNRLASVSAFLGLEEKTSILQGYWRDAAWGHRPSLKYVEEHCLQDIVVLRQAYLRLRPLLTTHPNLRLADPVSPDSDGCPVCGSKRIKHKNKYRILRTKRVEQFQCNNCGRWIENSGDPVVGEGYR